MQLVPQPPHLQQGPHHRSVAKDDEGDDEDVEAGEDKGVDHVTDALPVIVEEAPGTRELTLVAPKTHQRPRAEEQGEGQGPNDDAFGHTVGEAALVEVGEPEGEKSLHGHGADEKGCDHGEEDHGEAVVEAQWTATHPLEVVGVNDDGDDPGGRLTYQVRAGHTHEEGEEGRVTNLGDEGKQN